MWCPQTSISWFWRVFFSLKSRDITNFSFSKEAKWYTLGALAYVKKIVIRSIEGEGGHPKKTKKTSLYGIRLRQVVISSDLGPPPK